MLSKEQILNILAEYRPELSEEHWREEADLISVLSWLLPQEWKKSEQRLEDTK